MPPGDQDFQTADGNATVATRAYCKPKAGPAFLDELIIKETLGAHTTPPAQARQPPLHHLERAPLSRALSSMCHLSPPPFAPVSGSTTAGFGLNSARFTP